MDIPTNPEPFSITNYPASFWNTPETDEALANSECESDLVLSMRSMEKRMYDAIQEATNAVNDIIRVEWERNQYKKALENIAASSSHDTIDGWARNMAKNVLDSLPSTEARMQ